ASEQSTFDTAVKVDRARGRLSADSPQKLDAARRAVAEHLPTSEVLTALEVTRSEVITPMMFEFELLARACGEKKRILLPDGDDPRILAAADALLARGVAVLILLGEDKGLLAQASHHGHVIYVAMYVSNHVTEMDILI